MFSATSISPVSIDPVSIQFWGLTEADVPKAGADAWPFLVTESSSIVATDTPSSFELTDSGFAVTEVAGVSVLFSLVDDLIITHGVGNNVIILPSGLIELFDDFVLTVTEDAAVAGSIIYLEAFDTLYLQPPQGRAWTPEAPVQSTWTPE